MSARPLPPLYLSLDAFCEHHDIDRPRMWELIAQKALPVPELIPPYNRLGFRLFDVGKQDDEGE